MKKQKIALIHDYLIQYGGAEKTLEAILELFPDAPIYTGIYSSKKFGTNITSRKIIAPRNPIILRLYKYFTFLMPLVFENFDLTPYDIIISDGTAWPKGVLTRPNQLHISYIHTPPRFLYKYSVESTKRNKWYFKPIIPFIDHFLRVWDYNAAQRPDFLLTNSQETRKRIQKFYKRDAKVINPPVDIDYPVKSDSMNNLQRPYYLAAGRLVAYKNFDLLIQAFNLLDLPLIIIGTGIEEERLKKLAGSNITFTGRVSEEKKHELMKNALGLINPISDEDFGIVPIESMSHGTPVLAHKSGGHLEFIKEGINGMFFEELTVESLAAKIKEFDKAIRETGFDAEVIRKSVRKFSKEHFQRELAQFVEDKWKEHTKDKEQNEKPETEE